MYCFVCLLTFKSGSWLEDPDSGFSKRAINNSLMTRQLILGSRGSREKMHNIKGTPPCTFRQSWVNVRYCIWRQYCIIKGMSKYISIYKGMHADTSFVFATVDLKKRTMKYLFIRNRKMKRSSIIYLNVKLYILMLNAR